MLHSGLRAAQHLGSWQRTLPKSGCAVRILVAFAAMDHDQPGPADTALRDQAAAADAEAAAIARAAAAATGAHRDTGPPGPVEQAFIGLMIGRARRREITICPHLSPAAPQPEYWQAWAPGEVRCASCAERAYRQMRATGASCDHCAAAVSGAWITERAIQMPPVPGQAPVTVCFRLCADCQAANGQSA